MLPTLSLFFDVAPEPTGLTGVAIGVLLIVIVFLVGVLLAGFVSFMVWRKRTRSKAEPNLPMQAVLSQSSNPNQL